MAPGMVVSPILAVLLDKLTSLITTDSHLLQPFKQDLQNLSEILSSMRPRLQGIEGMHIKDPHNLNRITDLNHAAYDAEDLLEEIELEALTWESQITCINQVTHSLCFHSNKRSVFRRKIQQLILRFNQIGVEKLWSVIEYSYAGRGETSYVLTEPIMYGRARETESIIQLLLNNKHDLSICPIVGIAGLGKTTLAQLVYGDGRVVQHFDTRIWVSVAEDFGVEQITKTIIDHFSDTESCDIVDQDLMQNHVRLLLYATKFLIVLDDVWDDDREKWNKITHLLACGGKGSSIIVTTQWQKVVDNFANLSTMCVINPTCDVEPLHEDDAWALFKQYAVEKENEVNEDMIEIGKEIVAKCKGIPLDIKIAGSLLKSTNERFWRLVRDGEFWDLGGPTGSSLKSRYYNLPPIYRQCFAYCLIFPKGHEIEVEELIRLWIANGLVQTDGTKELEDVANEIFKELVVKSFFPNVEENWLGVKIFKMQDFAHHLAWLVARIDCLAVEDGDQLATISESVQHLLVSDGALEDSDQLAEISKSVRHLLVTDGAQSSRLVETISKSFPHLRTCLFPPMYNPPLPTIFENHTSLRALHLRGSNCWGSLTMRRTSIDGESLFYLF
ncbi:hypothetical protein ACHQM5_014099 [Ranunculus cassubicifolius]